ncbi:hypothetical protein LTR84_007896 [Exophiala bonariae]|uniref:RNase MRP protein 1 RNA binding domain-containing protein n=1 Tax=Exophiala bonariae TaxID=1690606 RepID=A0AAV9NPZ2_9EURO|nr:hypothetical protein LTR84_007896 [Exophiala bonariae]
MAGVARRARVSLTSDRGKPKREKAGSPRKVRLHPPRGRKIQYSPSIVQTEKSSVTASSASSPVARSRIVDRTDLADSLQLLNSLFVRNKNQHRNQLWWKPFCLLRNATRKFVSLQTRETELQNPAPVNATAPVSAAKDFRRRFELEAQVRREREIVGEWIREVLCPRCYVVFSGVVADTQFANLGVVLMGVLSEIAGVVGLPRSRTAETDERESLMQHAQATKKQARTLTAHSLHVTGPDRGNLVERVYDSDDLGEVVERQKDSPQGKGSTTRGHTDDDTWLPPLSAAAEAVVDEGTRLGTAIDQWPKDDSQSQDDDAEMVEESADGSAASKPKNSAPKNKGTARPVLQDQLTKASTRSSQSTPTASPPPLSSKPNNNDPTILSSTPKSQPAAVKASAPTPTVKANVLKKHKRPSEQNSPYLPEKNVGQSTEKRSDSKSMGKKIKKKRNAIDDMFAGFG